MRSRTIPADGMAYEPNAMQRIRELEKELAVATAERNSYRSQLNRLYNDPSEEAMHLRYNMFRQAFGYQEVIILGVLAPDEDRFANVKLNGTQHPYSVLQSLDTAKRALYDSYPELFEPAGLA